MRVYFKVELNDFYKHLYMECEVVSKSKVANMNGMVF